MTLYDLHCPARIQMAPCLSRALRRACEHNVDVLALTDHDSVEGMAEARALVKKSNCR